MNTIKSRRNIILALLTALICLGAEPSRASVLSETANAMAPGTWATLNTVGMDENYLQFPGGNGHPSTEFLNQAVWDSQGRKVLFDGAGHFNRSMTHIYTESTNTWTKGAPPISTNHGQAQNAINVAGRVMGFANISPVEIIPSFYNIDTNTWTGKAPTGNDGNVSHAFVYFPERDRWYVPDGTFGSIREFNANTNTWSTFAVRTDCFGDIGQQQTGYGSNQAAYNPARHEIIFGGGNSDTSGFTDSHTLCSMNASGVITVLPLAPTKINLPSADSDNSLITVDPVTGDILILTQHGQLFAFNFTSNAWTLIPNHATMPAGMQEASNNVTLGFVVPIDTYGVVMYFDYRRPEGGLYLYKHAQGGAPVTPPKAEQLNSGNGTGGPSIDLIPPNPPTDLKFVQSENPPPPPPPGSSFAALCALSTTIICQDFSAALPVDDIRFTEVLAHSDAPCQQLESVANRGCPEVENDALKFTIWSQSGAGASGFYQLRYSDLLPGQQQIHYGEEVFIQWRQRFDSNFLNTFYQPGEGFKQIITGTSNDSSCSINAMIVQNLQLRGYPQMYHACGFSEGFYGGIPSRPGDLDLQPGGPDWCSYVDSTNKIISPGCVVYFPNEWMTFQLGISHGQPGQNTRVRFWVAREGQPSVLTLDAQRVIHGEDQGYGLVTLTVYQTQKDHNQVHPEAVVLYDELIVSHTQLPDR